MLQRRSKTKAFTLLELLVTIALLGMMVGIVSNVLTQSSKLVTISETRIRQNNAAYSLAQVFRDFLRKASKNGLLCITDTNSGDTRPRLILTTVGPTPCMTGTGKGNAAFTILGLVNNNASFSDANAQLLWMPTYVLNTPGQPATGLDKWNIDFSTFQGLTRQQIDANIVNSYLCTGTPSNNPDLNKIKVPANTLDDVNLLWQVAGTGVSKLSIMWTDGNVNPTQPYNVKWYGRDIYGNAPNAQDPTWTSRTLPTFNLDDAANWQPPTPKVEYNLGSVGAPVYRALWTQANQNCWPKAIKIRFVFYDSSMPPDLQSASYEVIGTIGQ
jgi:prepilin-type N-terminal cleavage/methylation domain-containing protein